MARNIQPSDFLDIFKSTSSVVDDVTRRNANILVTAPTANTSYVLEDRIVQITTLSPAWVNLSVFSQTLAVFGGPIQITSRIRISGITADTILNLSYGIDGAEVTGNQYGLVKVDSLDFCPILEYTHIVTGVPSSTHTFSILANVKSRSGSGSGLSATLTMGIAERMMITEVK